MSIQAIPFGNMIVALRKQMHAYGALKEGIRWYYSIDVCHLSSRNSVVFGWSTIPRKSKALITIERRPFADLSRLSVWTFRVRTTDDTTSNPTDGDGMENPYPRKLVDVQKNSYDDSHSIDAMYEMFVLTLIRGLYANTQSEVDVSATSATEVFGQLRDSLIPITSVQYEVAITRDAGIVRLQRVSSTGLFGLHHIDNVRLINEFYERRILSFERPVVHRGYYNLVEFIISGDANS